MTIPNNSQPTKKATASIAPFDEGGNVMIDAFRLLLSNSITEIEIVSANNIFITLSLIFLSVSSVNSLFIVCL